ncbi:hypothetical protein PG994_007468 [Apiospora phragmitis]|uniref:Uncharacterized protein n=1 Tax=Apiospora phragmitis TaxID=2905665 RepID=A0ABR1V0Y2_9PEZI
MAFRHDYGFEKMREDAMRQATEKIDLNVQVKKRLLCLELQSAIDKIEQDARQELQAELQEIDNQFGGLIEADRPLDSFQLVPGQAGGTGTSESDSRNPNLQPEAQSPALGRESSILSSEMKDSAVTRATGSDSPKSASRGRSNKKAILEGLSPATVQQSESEESDASWGISTRKSPADCRNQIHQGH